MIGGAERIILSLGGSIVPPLRSMTDRENRLGVAIAGAGHSGSTLLGLVLGSLDDVFYAGEAKKTTFIGDPKKPLRKRIGAGYTFA